MATFVGPWTIHITIRVFDKNFHKAPNWLKSYMSTVPQSTMMGQSYSVSTEGLNHAAPKWSNKSSTVGHLVFSLGKWYAIVAYQIPRLQYHIRLDFMCLNQACAMLWPAFT